MRRFYAPNENILNGSVSITGSDVNHIKNVLRLKIGEKIEIFDSMQNNYFCEIKEITSQSIKVKVLRQEKNKIESKIEITLAQCLAKGKKMDFIVKTAVELGIHNIIPIISERSIPKIEGKEEIKIGHWQKISREAAELSGRGFMPKIENLSSIMGLNPKDYDLAIMPWEGERENSLYKLLTGKLVNWQTGKLLLLIGPEGGFSSFEAEQAKAKGFEPVSLGKRILRCETAALSAVSQIFFALEK